MNFFLDFRGLESKFVKFLMSILKWQVNSSSIFVSPFISMTHNSSINFNSYIFYFGQKDPIRAKTPILTLSSALVKIFIFFMPFCKPQQSFVKISHLSSLS